METTFMRTRLKSLEQIYSETKIAYLPEILVPTLLNTGCHNAEEGSNFCTTGGRDYFDQLHLVT
jgi:hypothetical protein